MRVCKEPNWIKTNQWYLLRKKIFIVEASKCSQIIILILRILSWTFEQASERDNYFPLQIKYWQKQDRAYLHIYFDTLWSLLGLSAKIVHWENHESCLSIFWGSAGPQPLRISRSLALTEFPVKSFALFMWWKVFEAYSQIHYQTDIDTPMVACAYHSNLINWLIKASLSAVRDNPEFISRSKPWKALTNSL